MNKNSAKFKMNPHNFKDEEKIIEEFLRDFGSDSYKQLYNQHGKKKYLSEIQKIVDKKSDILEIHLEDLEDFFSNRGQKFKNFIKGIKTNNKRYLELFTKVSNNLEGIERLTPFTEEEEFDNALKLCRLENINKQIKDETKDSSLEKIKKLLSKKFEVVIVPGPNGKKNRKRLRDLKANVIGHLINVRATVVKVSEVQPLMDLACYICENCQWECYKKVNSRYFDPPIECNSQTCKDNRNKGNLVQNFAMSKFISFQELKIQEISEETPVGSIPRTYTVMVKGTNVRKCTPGDVIDLNGVFLTQRPNKRMERRDNLVQDTYIEALRITKVKKSYDSIELTSSVLKDFEKQSKKDTNYAKLANSIAPEIFGMEQVKKALLLLMVGGSTINLPDGMKIRGDLNMGLIGDPGVAKSQLLKFITHLTPRGIYTTGKGSSGAGLTATITRDPITNEITLEGGALVLADKGICCIDEFDKMEEDDRVAIHEVMEQQTVSIAKAGITTRLNARTSILAAANPVSGRYNKNKSPHENINLPYSLLSRFDLIFILLDKADEENDKKLARHITHVHKNKRHPDLEHDIYSEEELKTYISHAKTFNPTIQKNLHEYVINKYVEKRKLNKQRENTKEYTYVTPRTLLGIIRLSQALAKLRFSNSVNRRDINEAIDLMENAQASIMEENQQENYLRSQKVKKDKKSQIYSTIRNIFKRRGSKMISVDYIENKVISNGFTRDDFIETIKNYEFLGLLIQNDDKTKLSLI